MTDPIADMIIRIKNALLASHYEVEMPHSKVKAAIAEILQREGYIEKVSVKADSIKPALIIKLKYSGKAPAITDVRRLSKPGRRMYSSASQIPRSLGGYGVTIVSTSKGIVTDKEARKQNIGGELICQIW